MKTDYCGICNRNVEYKIIDKEYEFDVNGIKVKYKGKTAICPLCGEELFVDEIEEENQKSFEREYINKYQIISSDDILEILDKYKIGKKPLAKLLGWGEVTIIRYLNGYIPSQKNSEILKKLNNSPEDYYSLLLTNKHNITKAAYEKSLAALETLLNIKEKDKQIKDNLIEKCANYIINKIDVTPMALQKILYYIQLFYIGFYKKPVFNSRCNAWSQGPVFGKIYHKYKEFRYNVIYEEKEEIEMNQELKEIVDEIIKCFGCYNGKVLEIFTHEERLWLNNKDKNDNVIDKNEFALFAKDIFKKYNINHIKDISNYSNYLIEKYRNDYK